MPKNNDEKQNTRGNNWLFHDIAGWFGFDFREKPIRQNTDISDHVFDWSEGKRAETLLLIYQYTSEQAQANINWYTKNAKNRKWWAIRVRILMLFALGLGTILPVLVEINAFNWFTDISATWATLIIAMGTGLLALDRYMAYSTSWMRFIRSELELKAGLEVFRYEWEIERLDWQGKEPEIEQCQKVLRLSIQLREEISRVVRDETQDWMQEFQKNLSFLDDNFRTLMTESRTGSLALTVENFDHYPEGYHVLINNRLCKLVKGNMFFDNSLSPGSYSITVIGVENNKQSGLPIVGIITIASNQLTSLTLSLPPKKPVETQP